MRLYAGPSKHFITQATQDGIASRLKDAFFQYYRYDPSPNEVNAWRYSLKALAQVFHVANLTDHGVFLEYALPLSSKRLDCMITGHDRTGAQRAVVVELKQWQACEESDGPNEVVSFVGGAQRDVLHPAAQVGQYRLYLEDTHTAFHEGDHPENVLIDEQLITCLERGLPLAVVQSKPNGKLSSSETTAIP